MTGAATQQQAKIQTPWKILGIYEYNHQTGISTYVKETEPGSYDPTVDDTTPTHMRKCKEEEWEWYICKGFLKGVTADLGDAISEQFYSQLKNASSPTATPPLSKTSTTLTQHGVPLTSRPSIISRMPTSQNGTATSTLPPLESILMTTKSPSCDLTLPGWRASNNQ